MDSAFKIIDNAEGDPLVVPKMLIKTLGLETSVLLSELCSEAAASGDGTFGYTRESLSDSLGMTVRTLSRCMKKLSWMGVVVVRREGFPRRNVYSVDTKKLKSLIGGE